MRLNLVELALLESLDMGKPIGDAMGYDAPPPRTASPGTPRR